MQLNSQKGHYWTFNIWQDQLENDDLLFTKLIDTHIRFVLSPFHDQDIITELDILKHPDYAELRGWKVGDKKTPHYHVMLHFCDNSTYKSVREVLDDIGLNCSALFVVRAPDGLYRYFCHQDNPEKAQYDLNQIRHFNGSEPDEYFFEISKSRQDAILNELTVFMRERGFQRYADFVAAVVTTFALPYYSYYAKSHVSYFKEILKDNLSDARIKIRNNTSVEQLVIVDRAVHSDGNSV